MGIYILSDRDDIMAYRLADEELYERLFRSGKVAFPQPADLPLRLIPGFGDAPDQPKALGDIHRMSGRSSLFSVRAVEALALYKSGVLFPVVLEGREEPFYWYWSTTVVDCLDPARTRYIAGVVSSPAFYEDKVGDNEIFTVPEDQRFQFDLYAQESIKEKIKKAKLIGFSLKKEAFDSKPWQS